MVTHGNVGRAPRPELGDVTQRPINIIRRNARVRSECIPWVSITALGLNVPAKETVNKPYATDTSPT